ncbi:MAG: triose-phosphate isomerase, partial [Candidatus Colwellbacteria bacterium]|nr:triose-phosphate isomerase [Candidatus Colwellbacteria bacterium]
EKMAASIRRLLPAARVLYGGSVTGANADEFLGSSLIAGVLVGGASLDADEFGRIVRQSERFSEEADGRAP